MFLAKEEQKHKLKTKQKWVFESKKNERNKKNNVNNKEINDIKRVAIKRRWRNK